MALESANAPRMDRPLSAALFDWARTAPDVTAIFLPQDGHVPHKTWRQLADDVLRMIAHLDRLGVCPGDRVSLLTPELSLRRDAIHRKFQQEVALLYAGGGVAVDYDDVHAPLGASKTENQPCDRS